MQFLFPRIAENQIQGDPNSGLRTLAGGLVDVLNILMFLVHPGQNLGRRGFRSETDMTDPAGPQQRYILVGHAAQKVRGGLERPFELQPRIEKPACDSHRTMHIHQKIRIHQRYFVHPVSPNQIRHFVYDTRHFVCVEPPVVENHVGAVVTGIRAANTGCVRKFTSTAAARVVVKIREIVSRRSQV